MLETRNISYSYDDDSQALKNVSLKINDGEMAAILGKNGAGKSTLFLHFNGIHEPDDGEILIDGEKLKYNKKALIKCRQKVGIVFQNPDNQIFAPSVEEDVAFGPLNLKLPMDEVQNRVEEALKRVGMEGFEKKAPHHLSGGQKKRVAIAGILAMRPEIMILDEQTSAFLKEIAKRGSVLGLDAMQTLMQYLGNPQDKLQIIHVAGTNGKGSTCAFITSVLREAGYSCGLFTSPHLVEINERFQINEEVIDDDTFLRAFEKVKKLSDELVAEGSYHPTYFETLLLMGMVIFAEAGVDYVTLETGLGGRLDATTAVENPAACVITSISLDHMQYLGNTVSEIAGEKAGIMVPGVPVIYDGNDPDAAGVMREHAEKLGCPYYELKREDTEIHKITKDGIRFSLKDETYGDTVFDIPFIARYQVMNAALAVKTIQVLENQIPVSLEALKAGMAKTRWQGRMETVLPGVIVDGAHNEDGVEKFVETAEHFQKEIPLTLLFSAVDDKDYTDMIRTICSRIRFRHVIVTQVGGYRKVPVEELAEIFREDGVPEVEAIEDVPAAFERAAKEKGEDGMLFCVGSLYLVGEIKAVIRRKKL